MACVVAAVDLVEGGLPFDSGMSLLPPYYNRELFSKHFLEQLLPQRAEKIAVANR